MKPRDMVLRCYAEEIDGQWQAFCIDLNLAAQADTFEDARVSLHSMIGSYVYDAIEGEDQDYADQLLTRRAPISLRLRYHYRKLQHSANWAKKGIHCLFTERLPLRLNHNHV